MKQWFGGFHGSSSIRFGAKNQGSPEEMLGVNSFNEFNDVAEYKQNCVVQFQQHQLLSFYGDNQTDPIKLHLLQ